MMLSKLYLRKGRKAMEAFYKGGPEASSYVTMVAAGEGVSVVGGVPTAQAIGRKAIIIIKIHKEEAITEENVSKDVAFIEIFKNPLECLSIVAQVKFHLIFLGRILPCSQQPRQSRWLV